MSVETVNVLLNAALQFNLEHLVERCEAFILRSLSLASLILSILLLPPPSLPPEDLSLLLAPAPTDNVAQIRTKISPHTTIITNALKYTHNFAWSNPQNALEITPFSVSLQECCPHVRASDL